MNVADYIRRSKAALGDAHMSDRVFGERYGVSASTISNARYYGTLPEKLALELAELLKVDAGEILLVAQAERAKPGPVKDALMDYAKKVLAAMPENVAQLRDGMAGSRLHDWRKRSVSPPRIAGVAHLEARPLRAFFMARPRA